jgi:phage terminase small subunit
LWQKFKKVKIMALAIKSPPILTGKAAEEFYKKVETFKCTTSKEEAQESYRKSKAFFAKYCNPYKS